MINDDHAYMVKNMTMTTTMNMVEVMKFLPVHCSSL
jgi:hypothetical protein